MGTARALVLLASGLHLAAVGMVCFLALLLGPLLVQERRITGSVVLAVVAFVTIDVVAVALANLLALRSSSTRRVVARGCGTQLAGALLGTAALLLLGLTD